MPKNGLMVAIALLCLALLLYLFWFQSNNKSSVKGFTVAMVQLSDVDNDTMNGFKEQMAKLGYVEGERVRYIRTGSIGSQENLEPAISKILSQHPDLIVVSSTNATLAVKRLTKEHPIPVIFAPVNNPLDSGVVSDLKHPGGHITGVRLPMGDDLRLQWLKKILPSVKNVYFPYSSDDVSGQMTLKVITPAAEILGINLINRPIANPQDFDEALSTNEAFDAIFLPRDSKVAARIDAIVTMAKTRKIPVCATSNEHVLAGAMLSYGFDQSGIGRQAAVMAVQVLKGISPGDLPVEMAESVLALNLDTAEELGIALSTDIVEQADYVIRNKQPLGRKQ